MRSAVAIGAHWILNWNAAITEAPASSVEPLQRAPFNAPMCFLCQFLDVETVHNSVSGEEHLGLLDSHPALRDLVRASILVGDRRWNLRLKNGLEVRLPETGTAAALERLVALNREKNLLTRDIVILDLRLPDRITVRLTDAAAAARIEALKDKPKKKANDA